MKRGALLHASPARTALLPAARVGQKRDHSPGSGTQGKLFRFSLFLLCYKCMIRCMKHLMCTLHHYLVPELVNHFKQRLGAHQARTAQPHCPGHVGSVVCPVMGLPESLVVRRISRGPDPWLLQAWQASDSHPLLRVW